jgi:Peptidase family S41
MIDGQNASDWLNVVALNGTIGFQDPDALYNSLFYEIANADVGGGYFFQSNQGYRGPSVTITFANGTEQEYFNYAITPHSFDGVDSGEAFYFKFCNATEKSLASQTNAGAIVQRQATATPSSTPVPVSQPRTQYPAPVVVSADGTLAGYFLNGTGYENTAVLSILAMSETDAAGCKQALSKFLAMCTNSGMTNLIIDISNNGGGSIIVGYEYFKQVKLSP